MKNLWNNLILRNENEPFIVLSYLVCYVLSLCLGFAIEYFLVKVMLQGLENGKVLLGYTVFVVLFTLLVVFMAVVTVMSKNTYDKLRDEQKQA